MRRARYAPHVKGSTNPQLHPRGLHYLLAAFLFKGAPGGFATVTALSASLGHPDLAGLHKLSHQPPAVPASMTISSWLLKSYSREKSMHRSEVKDNKGNVYIFNALAVCLLAIWSVMLCFLYESTLQEKASPRTA